MVFELNARLADGGITYLPLRLDRDSPTSSPHQYGRSLDLPTSPVACLTAEADGRPGVLLLDQVDAIRWTAAHSAHAWDTVERLVREVLHQLNLRVVVICRTFDVEDDRRIRVWKERQKAVPYHIGPLDDKTVDRVIVAAGASTPSLTAEQRRVLRSPQALYLWRIVHPLGTAWKPFRTMTGLMRLFWEEVRAGHVGGTLPVGWEDALASLVIYMDERGTLAAPPTLKSRWPTQVKALLSANVLVEGAKGALLFAHQSYSDYLTAERVLLEVHSGTGSVTDWLKKHDQSLFRRGQLRQLLTLLRDDDPAAYAEALRSILFTPSVRFHLRHLALQMLGQADPPIAGEMGLVLDLSRDDDWLYHLSSHVVVGRPRWFDWLSERGVLREWLDGADDKRRNLALTILERMLASRGPAVESLLLRFPTPVKRNWLEAVLWRTPPGTLSPRFFRAFCSLAKRGSRVIRFVDWKRLASESPRRFVVLLDACLLSDERARRIASNREDTWLDRSSLFAGDKLDAAVAAAVRFPSEAWDRLIPHLMFAASEARSLRRRRNTDDFRHVYERREYLRRIRRVLRKVLLAVGKVLAATEPDSFWTRIQELGDVRLASINRLLTGCIAAGPDKLADDAVRWLLAMQSRLSCGSGDYGSRYRPARRLIRRYAAVCSEMLLAALQARIMALRPAQERRSFKYRHDTLMAALRGSKKLGFDILTYNHIGLCRFLLLDAMPAKRLPPELRDYVGVLRRKFGPATPLLQKRRQSVGGFVGSVIPQERLHLLSDRDWLRIVSGKWPAFSTKWKAMGRGTIGEASTRAFSNALGQVARSQPRRFVRLMLRMPTGCDPVYPAAVIRAIADGNRSDSQTDGEKTAPASASEIEAAVVRFAHCLADRELAMAVCWAVERHSEEKWSERMLMQISQLATDHRDPAAGEFSVSSGERSGTNDASEMTFDVVASARSCVRGAAAYAIEGILFNHPQASGVLRPALEALFADAHPAVRVAALGTTLPLLNIDPIGAIEAFLATCDHADDRVLRGHDVARFLGHTIIAHLDRVRPLLTACSHATSSKSRRSQRVSWHKSGRMMEDWRT